jgi:hypothetical protein
LKVSNVKMNRKRRKTNLKRKTRQSTLRSGIASCKAFKTKRYIRQTTRVPRRKASTRANWTPTKEISSRGSIETKGSKSTEKKENKLTIGSKVDHSLST